MANGKGIRFAAELSAAGSAKGRAGRGLRLIRGRLLEGSIAAIPRPDAATLARYTQQVRQNSPYTPQTMHRAAAKSDCCIPDKTGGECPIKYVLYIIKENRTYDQVFGDFKDAQGHPAGNGDPALVMYGENVTPNHHQLARDYVLLDNLYCNGEVSVDGHDWCDGAIVTDFKQRSWIMSYSKHGVLPGNDEMETPAAGYLWDHCRRNGVTFKCYGEGAARVPKENRGTWPIGRDMDRVEGWISDLHAAEKEGDLPQLAIMALGEDHTAGTTVRQADARGGRRQQRRGPGQDRRGGQPQPVLEGDGDLYCRGRFAERAGPRRLPSHGGAGDQPLGPSRRGRQHAIHAGRHGANHRVDPRPAAHDPIRRGGDAHVRLFSEAAAGRWPTRRNVPRST